MLSAVVIYEDGRIKLIDPDLFTFIRVSKEDIVDVIWIEDIDKAGELTPRLRLFGISTDNFHDGWFSLRGGKKAYLMVCGKQAIAILTKEGYYIILSPENFEEFAAAFSKYVHLIKS